jgi:APA family basic amino acid/polyamine antiporter
MGRDEIDARGLKVAIGLPSAVMLVVGGIIGVGVFVNPAIVARSLHSPVLVLAAWGLGGVVALLGAFVYAELAARNPDTGGDYAYLRDTYGPLPAFLVGWTLLLVVQTGGMAAVVIVFAKNLDLLAGGGLYEPVIVVATLAALAGVNALGVGSGNGVQTSLGFIKVLMITALIVTGFMLAPHAPHHPAVAAPSAGPMASLKAFCAAMIPVVFSYGGYQTANFVAGEMRDARRNLARALVAGILIVITLYMLVTLGCLRALGIDALGATLTPASDVLRMALGSAGARLAAVAVGISALGYLSQSMLTAPRVYFAMAQDGLFFRGVGDLASGTRAPVVAIVVQAVWTAVLALSGSYEQILSYVIAMNFLFFLLSASCIFTLRARERRGGFGGQTGGFQTPGHPWTTGAFMLACVLVIASTFWAFPINSLIGYGILLLGVPPYIYWRGANRPKLT